MPTKVLSLSFCRLIRGFPFGTALLWSWLLPLESAESHSRDSMTHLCHQCRFLSEMSSRTSVTMKPSSSSSVSHIRCKYKRAAACLKFSFVSCCVGRMPRRLFRGAVQSDLWVSERRHVWPRQRAMQLCSTWTGVSCHAAWVANHAAWQTRARVLLLFSAHAIEIDYNLHDSYQFYQTCYRVLAAVSLHFHALHKLLDF